VERLTSYSHGAGCACKLAPGELAQVLRRLDNLPATRHPDLLVGIHGSDDAGVFRLIGEERVGALLSGLTRGAVFAAVIGRFTGDHAGTVRVA